MLKFQKKLTSSFCGHKKTPDGILARLKSSFPYGRGILKKRSFIEIRVTRSEFDEKKAAMTQIFFRYFPELSEKIMQPRNLYWYLVS